MSTDPSKPLSDEEIVELDELLAATPENRDPLDVVMLDGFLTGVLLQPDLVLPSAWLPLVFDVEGRDDAFPADAEQAKRAISLIMRRYNELAACIMAREPFDAIVFEAADQDGVAISGKDGVVALAPWAAGFATALHAFPGLAHDVETDNELAALVTGILRHLPPDPEAAGAEQEAYLSEQADLEREMPLADLDHALEELVACVLDIAQITRPNRPVQRATPKVGRNDPCPCGSGRKYKQCHGRDPA